MSIYMLSTPTLEEGKVAIGDLLVIEYRASIWGIKRYSVMGSGDGSTTL